MRPASQPVVEVEQRGWSPYHPRPTQQDHPQKDENQQRQPTASASSNTAVNASRRSSSPVFISAIKKASSSTLPSNKIVHQNGGNGKQNVKGQLNRVVQSKLFFPSEQERAKQKHAFEVVCPPITEPHLRSVFDNEGEGACIWSPSHRIAKIAEAVTCQWIVLDEGFGDIERCEKVFTTAESLAKHVLFAHCEPTRSVTVTDSPLNDQWTTLQHLLPCAWGWCKFKRYTPIKLKEHVLEHLRPLAFVCPFQECRMSANSQMGSAQALDVHIQTYHENGEVLLPLGRPVSLKSLLLRHRLPHLPKIAPNWLLHNERLPVPIRPIGLLPPKRKILSVDADEVKPPPGSVRPWDLVWQELNKLEPPAIPLSPVTMATVKSQGGVPPTIRITVVPPATVLLNASPIFSAQHIEIDAPSADQNTPFIDFTDGDIDWYPPLPEPDYHPSVDMTVVSLAKRDAKRESQNILRPLLMASDSSPSSSDEMDTDDATLVDLPHFKRIKLED